MTATRLLIGTAGLGIGVYGLLVLLTDNPWIILVRIAVWAGAGVVIHDFVFAPVCAALGFVGGRLIPRSWRAAVGVAALCSIVLGLLAIPVYDRPGAHLDNPTVLDRNYHHGLWVALAVVWVGAIAYLAATALAGLLRRAAPGDDQRRSTSTDADSSESDSIRRLAAVPTDPDPVGGDDAQPHSPSRSGMVTHAEQVDEPPGPETDH